nr:hypothetical protein [Pirellulaceae bacterium]
MKTSWIPNVVPTLLAALGTAALVFWLSSGAEPVAPVAEAKAGLTARLLSLGSQGSPPLTHRVPGL